MSPPRHELLMAYRWPVALVVSSLAVSGILAWTAMRLLSKPIPIAIEGGLQVDKLVLPPSITIKTAGPLPVAVTNDVSITGQAPLLIKGPLTVRAIEGAVKVNGVVDAQATVAAINAPVSVRSEQPFPVQANVTVDDSVSIKGNVNVDGNVGAKVRPGLLPGL